MPGINTVIALMLLTTQKPCYHVYSSKTPKSLDILLYVEVCAVCLQEHTAVHTTLV